MASTVDITSTPLSATYTEVVIDYYNSHGLCLPATNSDILISLSEGYLVVPVCHPIVKWVLTVESHCLLSTCYASWCVKWAFTVSRIVYCRFAMLVNGKMSIYCQAVSLCQFIVLLPCGRCQLVDSKGVLADKAEKVTRKAPWSTSEKVRHDEPS